MVNPSRTVVGDVARQRTDRLAWAGFASVNKICPAKATSKPEESRFSDKADYCNGNVSEAKAKHDMPFVVWLLSSRISLASGPNDARLHMTADTRSMVFLGLCPLGLTLIDYSVISGTDGYKDRTFISEPI